MKTQRETRSGPSCQTRRQTRSQTGRGGEIGPFPISSSTRSSTSNVAIIGGPKGPKRSTVEIETEKVEKKVKRAKTQKEALKEIARKATKDLLLLIQKNGYATTDSDTSNALSELLGANTSKEGNLKVHPACAAAFGAFEMPMKSRSCNTRALLADTSVLPWDHSAALGGQKIAKRNLKPNQLAQIESSLQRRNGTGKYAGFNEEDRHLVVKEQYKDQMEQGTGLAGHNADKELKLITRIPEMCHKFPALCRILTNGDGFDILLLKDDFKG